MSGGNIEKEKDYTVKALKDVNKLAFTANKKAYIFYIFLCLIGTANILVQLSMTQFIGNSAYRLFNKTVGINYVITGVILYSAVSLIFVGLKIVQNIVNNRLALDITRKFNQGLLNQLGSIKWDYYESHSTYMKIYDVQSKTLGIVLDMLQSTITYITTIPTAIILGYYLFKINIFAVFIYIIMVVIFNGFSGKMFKQLGSLWGEAQAYNQRQNYFFKICGDKITHQEYKFNRLFGFASSQWDRHFNKEYGLRIKIFKKFEITLQTARILFNIPYIVMMIVVAFEVAMGKHEIGFLLMANGLFNSVIDTFVSIQGTISKNRVDCKFVKEYNEVMEFENAPPTSTDQLSSDINMEDIVYFYPQSEYKALNHLNFLIKKGEKIAVVGVNGSGKTTCTNILLALTNQF